MASILKVDTIQDQSGNNIINESSDTITIGASGDTVNIVGTLQNNGSGVIQGITEADAWRITTNTVFSSSGDSDITANWERVDTDGFDKIGTGLSESSGIFSFPSTGYYYINYFSSMTASAVRDYVQMALQTTLNNSTYTNAASNYGNVAGTNYNTSNAASFILKVTDISNIKFKFIASRSDTFTLLGNTSESRSGFSTIRLGDI
jgi:hypothetical protein